MLFTKYYYGHRIKEDEMDGTCSTNEIWKTEGKILLWRQRHRWDDNIKMYPK